MDEANSAPSSAGIIAVYEGIVASLFGPTVSVACLAADAAAPDPAFLDDAWFKQASPLRQSEFSGGRACARRVLAELNMQSPVLRGTYGEPIWPTGVVGSISHAEGVCVAVGARAFDVAALGVDVHPDCPESAAFIRRICSERELSALRTMSLPVEVLAPIVFSAKEASYKLQFPLTRDVGAWSRLEVLLADETFSVRFDGAEGLLANGLLHGKWRRAAGYIWSGVALTPS